MWRLPAGCVSAEPEPMLQWPRTKSELINHFPSFVSVQTANPTAIRFSPDTTQTKTTFSPFGRWMDGWINNYWPKCERFDGSEPPVVGYMSSLSSSSLLSSFLLSISSLLLLSDLIWKTRHSWSGTSGTDSERNLSSASRRVHLNCLLMFSPSQEADRPLPSSVAPLNSLQTKFSLQ